MTATVELRLVEPDPASTPCAHEPRIFVRTLSAPPGAPWDQARSAALEAKIGAPLALDEVVFLLRRLDPWAIGRPARYAVCYVRRVEMGADYRTTISVEGRQMPVRFLAAAEKRRRGRRWAAIAGLALVGGVLAMSALSSALSLRSDASDRLANVERLAAVRLQEAKTQTQLSEQARLLTAAGAGHQTLDLVLGDLAWATAQKAPGAHIDALHWENGYLGVEVRGPTPPFTNADRAVERADRPIRPGVWLWGVGPAGSAPASKTAAP